MENRYNSAEEYAAMVRALGGAIEYLHKLEDEWRFLHAAAVDLGPVDLNGNPMNPKRKRVELEDERKSLPSVKGLILAGKYGIMRAHEERNIGDSQRIRQAWREENTQEEGAQILLGNSQKAVE